MDLDSNTENNSISSFLDFLGPRSEIGMEKNEGVKLKVEDKKKWNEDKDDVSEIMIEEKGNEKRNRIGIEKKNETKQDRRHEKEEESGKEREIHKDARQEREQEIEREREREKGRNNGKDRGRDKVKPVDPAMEEFKNFNRLQGKYGLSQVHNNILCVWCGI